MKSLTVAAGGMALVATSLGVASDFRLEAAKKLKLDAGAIANAESKASVGIVGSDKRSISFSGKSVRLVIRTGPETDMLSFRIQGLRNPTISVRPGASVTVLFVNTDGDMLHDLRLIAKRPPFTGRLGDSDSVGSAALPHANGGGFFAEKLTFKAPAQGAAYSYVCTVRGHAPGGMFGEIRVR